MKPICKCNNCNNLYWDSNPQTEQRQYDDELIQLDELENYNCPKCGTDAYLQDFEEELPNSTDQSEQATEIERLRAINGELLGALVKTKNKLSFAYADDVAADSDDYDFLDKIDELIKKAENK